MIAAPQKIAASQNIEGQAVIRGRKWDRRAADPDAVVRNSAHNRVAPVVVTQVLVITHAAPGATSIPVLTGWHTGFIDRISDPVAAVPISVLTHAVPAAISIPALTGWHAVRMVPISAAAAPISRDMLKCRRVGQASVRRVVVRIGKVITSRRVREAPARSALPKPVRPVEIVETVDVLKAARKVAAPVVIVDRMLARPVVVPTVDVLKPARKVAVPVVIAILKPARPVVVPAVDVLKVARKVAVPVMIVDRMLARRVVVPTVDVLTVNHGIVDLAVTDDLMTARREIDVKPILAISPE